MTADWLVWWWLNTPHECVECGATSKLTTDRIIPGREGGKYTMSNIQKLCYTCNCCKKLDGASVADAAKDVTERACLGCGEVKPLSAEYWHHTKHRPKYKGNSKSMWHPRCKVCRRRTEAERSVRLKGPSKTMLRVKYHDLHKRAA
jgi:hypothetical protein